MSFSDNRYDTFHCHKRKSKISYARCIQYQNQELEFWGANAEKYSGCPCETGRKIEEHFREVGTMATRIQECRNCGRVKALAQDGLCGGCFARCKGLTGAAKEEALAKAKADFQLKEKEQAPEKPDSEKPTPTIVNDAVRGVSPIAAALSDLRDYEAAEKTNMVLNKTVFALKSEPIPSSGALIRVVFSEADLDLYDELEKISKKYRRTPDQEILWILQQAIDYHNGATESLKGVNA